MPETVKEIIRYCFHELQFDLLICGYSVDNQQSKRVQEKCGL